MNKIININLAGRLIPMDEPAYEILNRYLDILKQYFGAEEGGSEILHDMEDRIGELLQEKIKKGAIAISIKDVEEIKAVMGQPEQIVDETGADENFDDTQQNKENVSGNGKANETFEDIPKHLHRSSNEKVIGGVCGGLSAYFNLDPAIVRLIFALVSIFWGSGILIYLILWVILPEAATTAPSHRRRWYRNDEKKIIGGVCSGIASYFNIDPVWPRLIFLVPVIMGLGFGFFHEIFFYSFGGFPAMILLYLILWAAMPKASTVAEKLEMRGKKVDIKNISEAMKNKQEPAKSSNSGCLNIFILLLKIIVIFLGAIVLIVLSAVAIGLICALLGIGVSSALVLPFSEIIISSPLEKTILIISLILVVVVPLYLLIYFLTKLISGRKTKMARWWAVTMIVLFIAGVFGLFALAGSVLRDFKTNYTVTEPLPLNPIQSDTLILSELPIRPQSFTDNYGFWDEDDFEIEGEVLVRFRKSKDTAFHASLKKSARGATTNKAAHYARQIPFEYRQNGAHLWLPETLDLNRTRPFRAQQVTIILSVPEGKWVSLKKVEDDWWNNSRRYSYNRGKIKFESKSTQSYSDYTVYQMAPNGTLAVSGQTERRQRRQTETEDNTYYY